MLIFAGLLDGFEVDGQEPTKKNANWKRFAHDKTQCLYNSLETIPWQQLASKYIAFKLSP